MGIGAVPGRQFPTPQQLVKPLPAAVRRLSQLHTHLLAHQAVMAVFQPGQRQPDIQIGQVGSPAHLDAEAKRQ
jgi:hypothetical protein